MTDDLLLVAADGGDLELLHKLKAETEDDEFFNRKCESVRDCEGFTCLHLAAEKGIIPICRFLIEKVNLDVNIKTDRGDSPLLVAASKGHFNTAKYFIIRGADITMSGYQGTTCLHLAAEKGNKELMQLLLLKGADIEADSVRGTPLQCAALGGNLESVRFLLCRGANPNSVSPLSVTPLMGAILCLSSECLELLLKAGADPNISSRGLSPLAVAAQKGSPEFLRSLIAAGADPNSVTTKFQDHDLKPIEHAAEAGNHEGVGILYPVTQSIPSYPDWSIHGITSYFHSQEATIQV
ncbi:hypothetical protein DH2020_001440 [Rehmannia glutinosa]|uniref:Ankyrin repeat protein n=1 Tax=Rehmannia glutinosa TaxID=99300 RepID=A0ABR0XZQ0_REHGL